MKNACTLALLACASAAAFSQSSVTVFGVVDMAARHVDNGGGSMTSLSSSGLEKNRLGFRGIEDLGDGLKAGFWLETGFNPDTGTLFDSTRFWNRRSTVSLIGRYGELRVGRDFTPTYQGFSTYDAFGTSGVGSADKFTSALGTAVDTLVRADNQVS
jgi:predicted porin